MHMHLETKNREAFELVTDALQSIDQYRLSREVSALDVAKKKLVSAIERDPGYFRARYYGAIVDDLSGHSKEAIATFQNLLSEAPPLINEVRYNLGVAEYHNYNHEALDRAINQFSSVAESSADLSLHLRAEAGLAQANAMHMIPKKPDEPDLSQLQHHFDAAMTAAATVLRELRKHRTRWFAVRKRAIEREAADEIEWSAYNARGMALMYYTDYLSPVGDVEYPTMRIRKLRDAIRALDRADAVSPRNWANYCDMASARMRLGYYEKSDKKSDKLFDDAIGLLKVVIDRLRPGYAFAIYETGRIYRLRGDFGSAVSCFERVLAVPLEERDISDRRPKIELDRARREDESFP